MPKNSSIHFVAAGVSLILRFPRSARMLCIFVFWLIAKSSIVSMVVFQIFLVGVFKILLSETLSLGFKIYLM